MYHGETRHMTQLVVSLQYDQAPESALQLRLFHVVRQLLRPGLKAALTARLIPPALLNAGNLYVQLSIRHSLPATTLPQCLKCQYNPVHEVYELAGSLTSLTKAFQALCPGCGFATKPCSRKDQVRRALATKHKDASSGLTCNCLSNLAHHEADFLQLLPTGCSFSTDMCHISAGSQDLFQPTQAVPPGRCCEGHANGSTEAVDASVEPDATRLMAIIVANIAIHILSATAGQTPRGKQKGSTTEAQQLLPWRAWAINVLTEDVDLIQSANWARPSFTDLCASLSAMTAPELSASAVESPAASAFKPIHLCPQSLLDTVLAPPWVAVSEPHAFETTSLERMAVLLKPWHGWLLQHRPQAAAATVAAVANLGYLLEQRKAAVQDLLSRLLALDPTFSTLPASTRLSCFLQCAGISGSIDQAMVKLDKVFRTKAHITSHVEACAHCGLTPSKLRPLCKAPAGSGGNKKHVCIMCKCSHCLVTMCVPCVLAAAGKRYPAEEVASGSIGEAEAAEAAACWPSGLCYWCTGAADILQARAAARGAAPAPVKAAAASAPLAGSAATPVLNAPAAGALPSPASMQVHGPMVNSTPLQHQQQHQGQEPQRPPQPQHQELQQHRRQQLEQHPPVFTIPNSRPNDGGIVAGSSTARFSLSHGTRKRPTQLLQGQHSFLRPNQHQQPEQSPQPHGLQGAPGPAPLQLGYWCSDDMDAGTGIAGSDTSLQCHSHTAVQQQHCASQQQAAAPSTANGCAVQPLGPSALQSSTAGESGRGQQQQQLVAGTKFAQALAAVQTARDVAAQRGVSENPAAHCLDTISSRIAAAMGGANAAQAAGSVSASVAAAAAAGPGTQQVSTAVPGCTTPTVRVTGAATAPLHLAAAPAGLDVNPATAAGTLGNLLKILQLAAAQRQATQHESVPPVAAPAAVGVGFGTRSNLPFAKGQQGIEAAAAAASAPLNQTPSVTRPDGFQLRSSSCQPLLQVMNATPDAGMGSSAPNQAPAAGATCHTLAPPAPQHAAPQPSGHVPVAPAVMLPAQDRLAVAFAAECRQQHSDGAAPGADGDAVRDVPIAGTPSSSTGLADALQTALHAAASRLAALPAQECTLTPRVSAALQEAAPTAATVAAATGAAMVGCRNVQYVHAGTPGEVQDAGHEACRKFMALVQALVNSGGSFATQAAGTLALGVAAGAARYAEVRGYTPQPAATCSGPAQGSNCKGGCSSNTDDAASHKPWPQHKVTSQSAQTQAAAAQSHARSRVPSAAAAAAFEAGADHSDYEPDAGAAEGFQATGAVAGVKGNTSALQYLTEDEQLALSTLMDLGHSQHRQGTRRQQQQQQRRHQHPKVRDQGLQPAAVGKKQHEQLLDQLQQQAAQGCWMSASVVEAWEQHNAAAAGAGVTAAGMGSDQLQNAAAAALEHTNAASTAVVEAQSVGAVVVAPEAAQHEPQLGLVKLLQVLAAGNLGQLQPAARGLGCVAEPPAVPQLLANRQYQPGCMQEANTSSAAGVAAPTPERFKRKRGSDQQSHAELVLPSLEAPAVAVRHLHVAAQQELMRRRQQQQQQQQVVPVKRFRSSMYDDYVS